MGSIQDNGGSLDALIVGAGFGGVYQLKRLRDEGYQVKLVDSASDYGGVWYWNRYPGIRVDIPEPYYQFSDPTLWKDWTWKQRFPGGEELRDYFSFVADKWDLRKDTDFNTYISSARWDDQSDTWVIFSESGKHYRARYLLLNTGFAAKRYVPDWKGVDKFQGPWIHPSYWPKEEPDLQGKKVAVIGTGSTGVQLAQELGKVAGEFILFQRTPNLALPMKQVNYTGGEQEVPKEQYPDLFAKRRESFGGIGVEFNFTPRNTFDDSPEKRRATYEELWKHGDFHFWLANYQDMLFSEVANKETYNFWKANIRPQIQDPRLQEILAPEIQPHGFGCKRPSLENGFYEIFNQPNVQLVDIKTTPIVEVTERGIKTTAREWELDYVVCATGFDAITGGLMQIDIQGRSGESLANKWKNGTKTYLGISVADFPNMFFTYGPQAPTAFCNGPACAEYQGDFIINVLNEMKKFGLRRIEAKAEAEAQWGDEVLQFANSSLLPKTKSWYMGDNIPGKPRESLLYLGGVPNYNKSLETCAQKDYNGFILS